VTRRCSSLRSRPSAEDDVDNPEGSRRKCLRRGSSKPIGCGTGGVPFRFFRNFYNVDVPGRQTNRDQGCQAKLNVGSAPPPKGHFISCARRWSTTSRNGPFPTASTVPTVGHFTGELTGFFLSPPRGHERKRPSKGTGWWRWKVGRTCLDGLPTLETVKRETAELSVGRENQSAEGLTEEESAAVHGCRRPCNRNHSRVGFTGVPSNTAPQHFLRASRPKPSHAFK